MNLKIETEKLVKQVFNDVYGYDPTKITDLAGQPPSKKNSYLFNPMFTQYEGKCSGKSADEYLFFIFFDPQAKDWQYSFTPISKK